MYQNTPYFGLEGDIAQRQFASAKSKFLTNPIEARIRKMERLEQGGIARVADLFAGCGGLSLGFHSAGMKIECAVENDPIAAKSHGINFFSQSNSLERQHHSIARNVETPPEIFARDFGFSEISASIDVLIGGPPCQAFARVGRSKLREIATHPEAFKQDERADLYLHYLNYVDAFQPLIVVMENVPDVINYGGHNIPEEICETLDEKGYVCGYTLLNSVFYGVPEMRERMFLVALAKELCADVAFPNPQNQHVLPQGYEGSRQVALKHVSKLFDSNTHFIRPPIASAKLPPAVTARQAIDDLPKITIHLEGKLKRGARRFTELTEYPTPAGHTEYSRLMRNWEGFESSDGIYDHVIRYLPRDYRIFKRMEPGDQYPQAHKLALKMLDEEVDKQLGVGSPSGEREALREELRSKFVPPYDATKFPNKWRKMEANAPARTLMAHLGKDGYSHIHYDSDQSRTISVREAARLQSFPDGFRFEGTMNPAFRQIGNAVPPLMAKAIAEIALKVLPRP